MYCLSAAVSFNAGESVAEMRPDTLHLCRYSSIQRGAVFWHYSSLGCDRLVADDLHGMSATYAHWNLQHLFCRQWQFLVVAVSCIAVLDSAGSFSLLRVKGQSMWHLFPPFLFIMSSSMHIAIESPVQSSMLSVQCFLGRPCLLLPSVWLWKIVVHRLLTSADDICDLPALVTVTDTVLDKVMMLLMFSVSVPHTLHLNSQHYLVFVADPSSVFLWQTIETFPSDANMLYSVFGASANLCFARDIVNNINNISYLILLINYASCSVLWFVVKRCCVKCQACTLLRLVFLRCWKGQHHEYRYQRLTLSVFCRWTWLSTNSQMLHV